MGSISVLDNKPALMLPQIPALGHVQKPQHKPRQMGSDFWYLSLACSLLL
jgi:hypothetical protein